MLHHGFNRNPYDMYSGALVEYSIALIVSRLTSDIYIVKFSLNALFDVQNSIILYIY